MRIISALQSALVSTKVRGLLAAAMQRWYEGYVNYIRMIVATHLGVPLQIPRVYRGYSRRRVERLEPFTFSFSFDAISVHYERHPIPHQRTCNSQIRAG